MFEGQITALLGHNGAGKTTTMSMLTGKFQIQIKNFLIQDLFRIFVLTIYFNKEPFQQDTYRPLVALTCGNHHWVSVVGVDTYPWTYKPTFWTYQLPQDIPTPPEGTLVQAYLLPGKEMRPDIPTPVNRLKDTSENITFPLPLFLAVTTERYWK